MHDATRRLVALGLVLLALGLAVGPHASVAWVDGLGLLALAASVGALLLPPARPLAWLLLLGTLTVVTAFTHPDAVALALAPTAGILGVIGLGLYSQPRLRLDGFMPEWVTLAGALAVGIVLDVAPALVGPPSQLIDILGAVFALLLALWLLVVAHRAFGPQSAK